MSVQISVEGRVVRVAIAPPFGAGDVQEVAGVIESTSRAKGQKVAVLAILQGWIGMPNQAAKREMKNNSEMLRSRVAELHLVFEKSGVTRLLAKLVGRAWSKRSNSDGLAIHPTDADAERVLSTRGFLRGR